MRIVFSKVNLTKNNRVGFSLIELLVVVSIIVLLSSILLSSLEVERRKARDVVRKSNLRTIQNAIELFAVTERRYPINFSEINTPDYLSVIPQDPNGSPYNYSVNCGLNCFHLWAELEAPSTGTFCWFSDPDGRREADCPTL